ncbi:YHYH protein [Vibrio nigripulchritudo]|nr:YHYH protein [Vibrio nigripulchritudo]
MMKLIYAVMLTSILVGCNGGSSDSDSASPSNINNSSSGLPQDGNITNYNFTSLSGDCLDYIGSLTSSVTDIQRSLAFNGSVSISSAGNKCVIESNHIPNHDFNDQSASFATNVSEQDSDYEITANPSFATSTTALSMAVSEGVFLNGVNVDMLAAACYAVGSEPLGREKIGCGQSEINNPWRYDPMSSLNGFGTDQHNAHVQPTGKYHYHGNPVAMFVQNCAGGNASPVIGFAADGFPIYGSCFDDNGTVRKATPSYRLKSGTRQAVSGYTTPVSGQGVVASANYDGQFRGDYEYVSGLGDLDECNGMTVNGQYGYYITDSFPWVLNCFKGTVDNSFSLSGLSRAHSHDGEYHTH